MKFLCRIGFHDLAGLLTETETGCDVHCWEWSVTRQFKCCIRPGCLYQKFYRFVDDRPTLNNPTKFVRAGAEPMTTKGGHMTSDCARPNRGIDYPDGRHLNNPTEKQG